MKELKLVVKIDRPIAEVFEFTTNPANTPLWIESITKEVSDSFPPKVVTIYQNWGTDGEINEYKVTECDPPKIFRLDAVNQDYRVRYTYTLVSGNETKLEYHEWSDTEELRMPFKQEFLNKLKETMESNP